MHLGWPLTVACIILKGLGPVCTHVQAVEVLPEDHCTLMQVKHHVNARARREFIACNETIPVKGSSKPMPAVGFGTCCRNTSTGQPIIDSTKIWLASGGRLIDTAQSYNNHQDIAVAIRESGVPREEIWVTDKVRPVDLDNPLNVITADDVIQIVDQSLKELELDYVDLMLLHWPNDFPPNSNVGLWQGLLNAKKAGKVLNVGVSNYNQADIEELVNATGEAPAVNQIEFQPWSDQSAKDLVNWLQGQGIAVTAYNVLGGAVGNAQGQALDAIAEKYQITNAQVSVRWALEKGVAPLVGATSQEHIQEDLNCSVPDLSAEDISFLENAEKPPTWKTWNHPHY